MSKRFGRLVGVAALIGGAFAVGHAQRAVAPTKPAHDYPVKPVPFTAVHLTDHFWAPKIEVNRTVTIPFAFQRARRPGASTIRARRNRLKGEPLDKSEAAGLSVRRHRHLQGDRRRRLYAERHPDPKLEAYLDGLIAKIAAAQEKDGYLYTTRTIDPQNPHPWAGTERWQLEND